MHLTHNATNFDIVSMHSAAMFSGVPDKETRLHWQGLTQTVRQLCKDSACVCGFWGVLPSLRLTSGPVDCATQPFSYWISIHSRISLWSPRRNAPDPYTIWQPTSCKYPCVALSSHKRSVTRCPAGHWWRRLWSCNSLLRCFAVHTDRECRACYTQYVGLNHSVAARGYHTPPSGPEDRFAMTDAWTGACFDLFVASAHRTLLIAPEHPAEVSDAPAHPHTQ